MPNRIDDSFDFGFSIVSEDELSSVSQAKTSAMDAEERYSALYNMIMPLLKNLKSNPTKEFIHWPDRVTKIDEFIKRINDL